KKRFGRCASQAEGARCDAIAAIRHGVKQHTVRLRQIHRLDECESRRVFDHPTRIAWRELKVGNDRVMRVFGIELAVSLSGKNFVLPDAAERLALISGRLSLLNYNARHPRFRCNSANKEAGGRKTN